MERIKKVAIIGAGSWGTAVAKDIAESNPHIDVVLWAYEKSVAARINSSHENTEYLRGIALPVGIRATSSLKDAVQGAGVVILATPSKVVYDIAQKISRMIGHETHVAFLTKGFCKIDESVMTISQALEKALPMTRNRVVAVSGPSHAEEVARRYHTCLSVGSKSEESRAVVARLLNSHYVQCLETDDILGVEVGGTLKNPAAIAAGMISVLPRCGDNLAGALVSEALKEMIRLGSIFNISPERIMDISGLGDLVATALSEHSRNRRFGKDISKQIQKKGKTLTLYDRLAIRIRPRSVIERMSERFNYLAEGAYAIEPLIELAESHNIEIPVYRALYEVLRNKKDPSLLVESIKNPEKFDEIFFSTKIRISDRRRGLEGVKGRAFREMIVARTVSAFGGGGDTRVSPYDPDAVIANLKDCQGKGAVSGKREGAIIDGISMANFHESIDGLSRHYAGSIADNYTPLFKWMLLIYLSALRTVNFITGMRGRIRISGATQDIRAVSPSVNVLYLSDLVSAYDPMIVLLSIARKRLPFPRFFLDPVAGTSRELSLLRRCGGFVVERERLDNMVYRETLKQYLVTLAGHGVPVLYFTSRRNTEGGESDEFFEAVTESLYDHTVEMAVVPVEISYLDRPERLKRGGMRYRDVLANYARVNFSKPVFLSEYTKQPHMIIGLPGVIGAIRDRDRKFFPHHVICKILADNDYSVPREALAGLVKAYLSTTKRVFDEGGTKIARRGLLYCDRRGITTVRDGTVKVIDRELADYFANMLA